MTLEENSELDERFDTPPIKPETALSERSQQKRNLGLRRQIFHHAVIAAFVVVIGGGAFGLLDGYLFRVQPSEIYGEDEEKDKFYPRELRGNYEFQQVFTYTIPELNLAIAIMAYPNRLSMPPYNCPPDLFDAALPLLITYRGIEVWSQVPCQPSKRTLNANNPFNLDIVNIPYTLVVNHSKGSAEPGQNELYVQLVPN